MVEWTAGALAVDPPLEASVVTLGTFDGVHCGHRELVRRARKAADQAGVPAVAYTFDPHPARVLVPEAAPPTIQTLDRRVAELLRAGVHRVVVERFDGPFSRVDADTWVRDYLWERLRPRRVVVGFNFTYGRQRGGDPSHLRRMGSELGFAVEEVAAVQVGDRVASSSRIRAAVEAGDLATAAVLLGRPFSVTGQVVAGDRRGRSLGFPTANVLPEAELLPGHGVYASRLKVLEPASGRTPPELDSGAAVTNVGLRPTFDGGRVTVETHVLDAPGPLDLYGCRVEVELLERIRGERRFDGIEALVDQIGRDVGAARRIHGIR